jgi:hypothetical protein
MYQTKKKQEYEAKTRCPLYHDRPTAGHVGMNTSNNTVKNMDCREYTQGRLRRSQRHRHKNIQTHTHTYAHIHKLHRSGGESKQARETKRERERRGKGEGVGTSVLLFNLPLPKANRTKATVIRKVVRVFVLRADGIVLFGLYWFGFNRRVEINLWWPMLATQRYLIGHSHQYPPVIDMVAAFESC